MYLFKVISVQGYSRVKSIQEQYLFKGSICSRREFIQLSVQAVHIYSRAVSTQGWYLFKGSICYLFRGGFIMDNTLFMWIGHNLHATEIQSFINDYRELCTAHHSQASQLVCVRWSQCRRESTKMMTKITLLADICFLHSLLGVDRAGFAKGVACRTRHNVSLQRKSCQLRTQFESSRYQTSLCGACATSRLVFTHIFNVHFQSM